ncbi:hypothetical protein ACFYWD_03775 [Streptomyces sp. NPDC003781]|uniref:hypothetical protein n=1 Tax=Streptomyces sp. NPDC003781 TaxID=3364686 RepID=UPI0036852042
MAALTVAVQAPCTSASLRLVLVVLVPPACPPAFRPVRQSRWRLRRLLLVHTLATRGPPAVTAVV